MKLTSKGKGWHFESMRHSNARKFGHAGGQYASLPYNSVAAARLKMLAQMKQRAAKYAVGAEHRKRYGFRTRPMQQSMTVRFNQADIRQIKERKKPETRVNRLLPYHKRVETPEFLKLKEFKKPRDVEWSFQHWAGHTKRDIEPLIFLEEMSKAHPPSDKEIEVYYKWFTKKYRDRPGGSYASGPDAVARAREKVLASIQRSKERRDINLDTIRKAKVQRQEEFELKKARERRLEYEKGFRALPPEIEELRAKQEQAKERARVKAEKRKVERQKEREKREKEKEEERLLRQTYVPRYEAKKEVLEAKIDLAKARKQEKKVKRLKSKLKKATTRVKEEKATLKARKKRLKVERKFRRAEFYGKVKKAYGVGKKVVKAVSIPNALARTQAITESLPSVKPEETQPGEQPESLW